MIIVHITEAFGGGIIDFIHSLTEGINGHKHYIIRSKRQENVSLNFGSKVEFIDWPNACRKISIKDIKAFLSLLKILKGLNFDVLHLHSSKAGVIGRLATLFTRNCTVIYTPNGVSFDRKDINSLTKLTYMTLEWVVSKINGITICVSLSEAKLLQKIGIKSYFVNNGVESFKVFTKKDQKEDNHLIKIVTIGRASTQKNPRLFNRIAESFEDQNIVFFWIGDGELANELTSKNIIITGWLTKAEIAEYLNNADIYLSTSLWEGLPFSVLDAMNYSLPLILHKCTGNIDLVWNGENGVIFSSVEGACEAISALVNDPKKRNLFGKKSKNFLKINFRRDQMIKDYRYAYSGKFEMLKKP